MELESVSRTQGENSHRHLRVKVGVAGLGESPELCRQVGQRLVAGLTIDLNWNNEAIISWLILINHGYCCKCSCCHMFSSFPYSWSTLSQWIQFRKQLRNAILQNDNGHDWVLVLLYIACICTAWWLLQYAIWALTLNNEHVDHWEMNLSTDIDKLNVMWSFLCVHITDIH